MKELYCVYKHTVIENGRVYIGVTCQKPEHRWGNGKGYQHIYFKNAIDKYGWGNISHEILHSNISREEADRLEVALIAEYRSNDKRFGYNISNGGRLAGKHSNETKLKISQAGLGRKQSLETIEKRRIAMSGDNNHNYGRVFSEEHRRKLSESHTGNRNHNFGKKFSEEHRRKLSESMRGKQAGGKHKMYGQHHSENTKQKIRESQKRRPVLQYSKDGIFIKRYDSLSEAARENSRPITAICAVCAGRHTTTGGYMWRYDN